MITHFGIDHETFCNIDDKEIFKYSCPCDNYIHYESPNRQEATSMTRKKETHG